MSQRFNQFWRCWRQPPISAQVVRCACAIAVALFICVGYGWAQASPQATAKSGSLRGQVTDPTGAVVPDAAVAVTTPAGATQNTVTDKQGNYLVRGLPEGSATLRVTAPGFAVYEMPNVIIRAGEMQQLDVGLGIAVQKEQITVQSESGGVAVDVAPESSAGATILKGEDLEALPDDPDELEQDLLALAGPSVGPNGGQIFIDGFSGGTLPPKSSIREIRINQNPFSAEYDKPGYGRIEIFTKPGTEKWHGRAMFNENNSVFNSRNPYVHGDVPDYHSEIYEGDVSGSLGKRLSIFLNAQRRSISELAVVNNTLVPNGEAIPAPERRTNLSGRMDWQLSANNTLTARYQFMNNDQQNVGVGGLTLPSRGYTSQQAEHTLQLSDTQILSPRLINETRFQFIRNETSLTANQGGAAINVLGEFATGGSTVGRSDDVVDRYELQNFTSWTTGTHFVRFGGRLRVVQETSIAPTNFNGTFTFSNFAAFQAGAPSQFTVTVGNARTTLAFADAAVFGEDDWKLRPNLTFSYGLRVETQSSIHDKADFAPRLVLSWGLGKANTAPKTVLRFGWGIFYDRFTDDLVLQAERVNGITQEQFVITNPPFALDASGNPILPCDSIASCQGLASASLASPTIYQISPTLHAPYTIQSAVSLERQLGKIGTFSLTYLNSVGQDQFILINANAPECEVNGLLVDCVGGTRPLGNDTNLYQYNSKAIFRQNQIMAHLQLRVSRRLSLMGHYTLNYASSDTGGPNSNPSNQFNLMQDYGRASFDVRHRLFLVGSASLAHNIRISPFVVIRSGAPFNITTGEDNGNTFFNERPSIGGAGCIVTAYGCLNPNPAPGERPIPINSGNGPANVTVNLRLSKTFGFGQETSAAAVGQQEAPPHGEGHGGGRGGPGGGGGFGGPRGMGGIFAPPNTSRPYNLTLTMFVRNVFNYWNPGPPIGNLLSSQFGRSVSLAGGPFSSGAANRRVDFQALFTF